MNTKGPLIVTRFLHEKKLELRLTHIFWHRPISIVPVLFRICDDPLKLGAFFLVSAFLKINEINAFLTFRTKVLRKSADY